MRANYLIKRAKLILDSNGKRKAVQLDYTTWDQLLGFLEDIEDIEEIDRARAASEEAIPWEHAKEELRAKGVDV